VTDNGVILCALNRFFTTMEIQSVTDDSCDFSTILNQVRNDVILSGTN
jgi:hypothetical protein